MRGTPLVLAVVVGCGDNLVATGAFHVVGHADLRARGMSSAFAVPGDTVYVGSRIDNAPIEILDVHDPAQPLITRWS